MRKSFTTPAGNNNSGLYIFRDAYSMARLKKSLYVDGQFIGETEPMTYVYHVIPVGQHILSTESEFGNNDLSINVESGKNYFFRQFMKLGVFVDGAILVPVSEEEGKKGVLECKLAQPMVRKARSIDASSSY